MITIATFGIESAALCQGFEEGGLSAAVLTDEERYVRTKRQINPSFERRDIEWISGFVELSGIGGYLTKEWRARR
jgi:hypothetical protein